MSLHSLTRCLAGHHRLLVAFSGGLDSTVLLHQLVSLRQQHPELLLRAIHIHHGLSQYADEWVLHCQQQCLNWQVALETVHVTVKHRGRGIEAAARAARYQAFRQHLQAGECLLTAQHQDDQCETFLLALKRGSGPAGLSAMPASAVLGKGILLRPLLSQTRLQLESWAAEHELAWIEDDSNQHRRFDRNFLRQAVLPDVVARWPHFPQAVARSAALCAEQEQLLDELLADSLAELVDTEGALAWPPLATMSEVRRSALLRRWIAQRQGLMPSREALLRLWQEVACSREDADPHLQLGQFEVRRYRERLYWIEQSGSLAERVVAWTQPDLPLVLPEKLGWLQFTDRGQQIRPPESEEAIGVRFQAQGKFHIVGRAGSRALKKIWQEQGIPPWQRERTPLLFYGDTLIAAAGLFVTREGEPGKRPCWNLNWKKYQP